MDFSTGDKVRVKDGGSEVFTISQLSENKCWIGDEDGRGWYIYLSRLELAESDGNEDTLIHCTCGNLFLRSESTAGNDDYCSMECQEEDGTCYIGDEER